MFASAATRLQHAMCVAMRGPRCDNVKEEMIWEVSKKVEYIYILSCHNNPDIFIVEKTQGMHISVSFCIAFLA